MNLTLKSKVAVIRCEDYQESAVRKAVRKGLEQLGGIGEFGKPGEKLLLKPNLLSGRSPERMVTVHPLVFKAVAEVFQESGFQLTYGDSPSLSVPENVSRKAGLFSVAEAMGIPLADFQKGVKISYPQAQIAQQLKLAPGVLEADGMISIAKMKTHALTRITGAVKNQFGCVPGLLKGEFHVKMPDIFKFSAVLVDICTFLKPRLYIMDGIWAMEGNGHSSGTPRQMKVLLFSTDPVALDAVFCRLIHLKPEFVPFMKIGENAGLGTYLTNQIEILGDELEELIQPDFKVVRRPADRFITSRYFPTFLKNQISPKPVINKDLCIKCGACVEACPVIPKAVNWSTSDHRQVPVYDYKHCIRCYCCQENCPYKAIFVETPWLGKLLLK